jgi:hypothetical protein
MPVGRGFLPKRLANPLAPHCRRLHSPVGFPTLASCRADPGLSLERLRPCGQAAMQGATPRSPFGLDGGRLAGPTEVGRILRAADCSQ